MIFRSLGQLRTIVSRKRRGRNDEAYLLGSPANAERLLRALERIRAGGGTPFSSEELRAYFGLNDI